MPETVRGQRVSANGESLVVVKLDRTGGQASAVFEILEQAGLLEVVSEQGVEMVEAGALGFRVPRDRMVVVVLALECSGFTDIKAYEVEGAERNQS
jgi:hypothetical protein